MFKFSKVNFRHLSFYENIWTDLERIPSLSLLIIGVMHQTPRKLSKNSSSTFILSSFPLTLFPFLGWSLAAMLRRIAARQLEKLNTSKEVGMIKYQNISSSFLLSWIDCLNWYLHYSNKMHPKKIIVLNMKLHCPKIDTSNSPCKKNKFLCIRNCNRLSLSRNISFRTHSFLLTWQTPNCQGTYICQN